MNKKIFFILSISILLVGTFSFATAIITTDKFSCDNLGIIYIKPSEINSLQGFKDMGIIIKIPEYDRFIANSKVFQCENIDLYLGDLKNVR